MKAFPTPIRVDKESFDIGMDLRDYFAAKATDEDIAPYINDWENPRDCVWINSQGECLPTKEPSKRPREVAKYLYADAMIKARTA